MRRVFIVLLAVLLAAPPLAGVTVLAVTAPVALGPAFAIGLGTFGLWLGMRHKRRSSGG